MKLQYKITLILAAVTAVILFVIFFNQNSAIANHTFSSNNSLITSKLGYGYNSYDKMFTNQIALNFEKYPPVINYGNVQSTLHLSHTIDYSDIAQILNIDISASGGWGDFSASGAAQYLRNLKDTKYSESFIYAQNYIADVELDFSNLPANRKEIFTEIAEKTYQKGIQDFTDRYGNEFITKLPMGAILLVEFKINFSSAKDKTSFHAKAAGGIGTIFNSTAEIEKIVSETGVKGHLDVSAYQLGGNPTRLGNIFKEGESGYYITSCSLDNLEPCQKTISGVIEYAQKDFSKQIRNDGENNLIYDGGLAVVGEPALKSYSSRFNDVEKAPELSPAVKSARSELEKMNSKNQEDSNFVNHLLLFDQYFNFNGKKDLMTLKQNLDWNHSLFYKYDAINCYTPGVEKSCPKILKMVRDDSKNIDEKVLEHYKKAYLIDIPSWNFKYLCWPIGGSQCTVAPHYPIAVLNSYIRIDSNNMMHFRFDDIKGKRFSTDDTGDMAPVSKDEYLSPDSKVRITVVKNSI